MNNDFNDLLQDALDMPYEEKINLTKEAVDKLYNVLIRNNKDEAMPDMLKIFGYFIKLDNIIAFDEIPVGKDDQAHKKAGDPPAPCLCF